MIDSAVHQAVHSDCCVVLVMLQDRSSGVAERAALTRLVTQFQVSGWTDDDCPGSTSTTSSASGSGSGMPVTRLLELRRRVRQFTDALLQSEPSHAQSPLLVHCRHVVPPLPVHYSLSLSLCVSLLSSRTPHGYSLPPNLLHSGVKVGRH